MEDMRKKATKTNMN